LAFARFSVALHLEQVEPCNFQRFAALCRDAASADDFITLPILAAAYCLWIWFLKADRLPSWVAFFATTMSILVLLILTTLIAALLPLISVADRLASN
jgi:hypothetical protein